MGSRYAPARYHLSSSSSSSSIVLITITIIAPSITIIITIIAHHYVTGAVSSNSIDHLPFAGAELHLKMINGAELQEDTTYQLQVFRENNIGDETIQE